MVEESHSPSHELLRQAGKEAGIEPVKELANENERMSEVHRLGLLNKDMTQDKRFNSITQVATYLTGCSQSSINILGSKIQICKASFGFSDQELEDFTEIPRDISVCQYSLEKPGQPLIIENLLVDQRTKNWINMPVDPGFRFYTSLPLMTSKGYPVGTLCVYDFEPKKLCHEQIDGLRLLSDQIVYMMESGITEKPETPKSDEKALKSEKKNGNELITESQYYSAVSILFADFVGFTSMVENTDPGDLIRDLGIYFSGFEKIINKYEVRKVKTIGDCFMCVSGIPSQKGTHAINMCLAATDMLKFVDAINAQNVIFDKPQWHLRIGIHSGPVIAGSLGNVFDIWGDAVNIAARVESMGEADKIHITEKTSYYLKDQFNLIQRGEVELKGKGKWSTFFLTE